MKNIVKIFIGIFFVSALISCESGEKPSENKGNIKALIEIKKEPKIIEAFISDANVLYVSVKSDGTSRKGYAMYLCEILKENNASCDWVKVVEFGTIGSPKADNAYGVLLGENKCG